MIGIYKITNPKGRVYIGQSTNVEKRINNYKKLFHCNYQIKLYRSFLKYGITNHTFEIIEECEEQQLNNKERYYQDLYSVIEIGLNCRLTKSDDKSGKLSNDTKLKISLSNIGRKCNKDTRLKISFANTGKLHSDETKKKISLSKLGSNHTSESKLKIGISSKNRIRITKQVINTTTNEIYRSITHASQLSGISVSWLNKMLRGVKNNTTVYKFLD